MDKQALLDKIAAAAEAGEIRLDLRASQLTELPPEIGQLNKLRILDLSGNQLRALPPEIGQLTNLGTLYLHNNELTALPAELDHLKHLTALSPCGNHFTVSLINQIKKYNLTKLWFWGVPMAQCPPELMEMTTLTFLNLGENQLTELPPAIVKLNKLELLYLHNNQLTELPTELHQLEALHTLNLDNNPNLRFPPEEIVALGAQPIKNFLRAAHAGNQHVWESKLLLVGEGGVGKTSLLNALNGALLKDKYETGTVGIEIGDLSLPCPNKPDAHMHLRCWDFAGQDFNHATHQFFFSNRALFLLVWNARHGYQQGKLYRWLENIQVRAPKARVILVATHMDQPHSDYPMADLRAKYPQLVHIAQVSNQTGTGIEALRNSIQTHAAELPLMGLRWPTTWLAAANAVRALTEQHMPRQTLKTLIQTHGLDTAESDILMRWLHDLGDILLFQDEADIRDLVVLDPGWMIQHVGMVLRSDEVKEKQGILTQAHLQALWPNLDSRIQDHFLRMMDKFDLAYLIPNDPHDRSLIVERLSHDPVDYQPKWETFNAIGSEIKQRFRLGSMQPGIPSWFIARCHRFTTNQHWLFGVLFQDAEPPRHLALIQADLERHEVDITVRGPFPQRFMSLLQDGFLDTLKRYQGLNIERLIPCPGYNAYIEGPCQNTFKLAIQEKKLVKNPDATEFHCNDCDTTLSRLELIEGMGAGALTQRFTQNRTQALMVQQTDFPIQDVLALHQRNFINLWRQEQENLDISCPNVFTLQSKGKKSLMKAKKYQLQLYCQQPGHWHSVGATGCYEFKLLVKQVTKVVPYLLTLRNILKLSQQSPGMMQPDVQRMMSLLDNIKPKNAPPMQPDVDKHTSPAAATTYEKVAGAQLDVIRKLMDQLTKSQPKWGGLTRCQTPEGDILWLCAKHRQEYESHRKKPDPEQNASSGRSAVQATPTTENIGKQIAEQWLQRLAGHPFTEKPETRPGYPAFRAVRFRLRDIGPFHDTQEITLQPDINVFLGDNASGKSTLLRCLALASLGVRTANQVESHAGAYLRKGVSEGYIEVIYQLLPYPKAGAAESGHFWVGLQIIKQGAGSPYFDPMPDGGMTLTYPTATRGHPENAALHLSELRTDGLFGFVCGYGAPRRFSESADAIQQEADRSELDWVLSLFSANAWLDNPETFGKLIRGDTANLKQPKPDSLPEPILVQLQTCLTRLFPEVEQFWDSGEHHLRLGGVDLHFAELSDGYRSLFALFGHFLRSALKVCDWKHDPTALEAMVLLDEIDLHLHPTWQQHVVKDFKAAFAHTQLIASTHSPLVVSALKREAVFIVRREDSGRINIQHPALDPQGLGVSGILTQLFDLGATLDQPTLDKITRRVRLHGQRDTWSEQEKLEHQALSDELAALGFNHEFSDPYFEQFAIAMAKRHQATLEKRTPEQKQALDDYADALLADILQGVDE